MNLNWFINMQMRSVKRKKGNQNQNEKEKASHNYFSFIFFSTIFTAFNIKSSALLRARSFATIRIRN